MTEFINNNITLLILNILNRADRYGQEIARIIGDNYDGEEIKLSAVYSCLKKLESQNYVKSYWGDESQGGRRLYYKIIDKGSKICAQNFIEIIEKPYVNEPVETELKQRTIRRKPAPQQAAFDQAEFERRLSQLTLVESPEEKVKSSSLNLFEKNKTTETTSKAFYNETLFSVDDNGNTITERHVDETDTVTVDETDTVTVGETVDETDGDTVTEISWNTDLGNYETEQAATADANHEYSTSFNCSENELITANNTPEESCDGEEFDALELNNKTIKNRRELSSDESLEEPDLIGDDFCGTDGMSEFETKTFDALEFITEEKHKEENPVNENKGYLLNEEERLDDNSFQNAENNLNANDILSESNVSDSAKAETVLRDIKSDIWIEMEPEIHTFGIKENSEGEQDNKIGFFNEKSSKLYSKEGINAVNTEFDRKFLTKNDNVESSGNKIKIDTADYFDESKFTGSDNGKSAGILFDIDEKKEILIPSDNENIFTIEMDTDKTLLEDDSNKLFFDKDNEIILSISEESENKHIISNEESEDGDFSTDNETIPSILEESENDKMTLSEINNEGDLLDIDNDKGEKGLSAENNEDDCGSEKINEATIEVYSFEIINKEENLSLNEENLSLNEDSLLNDEGNNSKEGFDVFDEKPHDCSEKRNLIKTSIDIPKFLAPEYSEEEMRGIDSKYQPGISKNELEKARLKVDGGYEIPQFIAPAFTKEEQERIDRMYGANPQNNKEVETKKDNQPQSKYDAHVTIPEFTVPEFSEEEQRRIDKMYGSSAPQKTEGRHEKPLADIEMSVEIPAFVAPVFTEEEQRRIDRMYGSAPEQKETTYEKKEDIRRSKYDNHVIIPEFTVPEFTVEEQRRIDRMYGSTSKNENIAGLKREALSKSKYDVSVPIPEFVAPDFSEEELKEIDSKFSVPSVMEVRSKNKKESLLRTETPDNTKNQTQDSFVETEEAKPMKNLDLETQRKNYKKSLHNIVGEQISSAHDSPPHNEVTEKVLDTSGLNMRLTDMADELLRQGINIKIYSKSTVTYPPLKKLMNSRSQLFSALITTIVVFFGFALTAIMGSTHDSFNMNSILWYFLAFCSVPLLFTVRFILNPNKKVKPKRHSKGSLINSSIAFILCAILLLVVNFLLFKTNFGDVNSLTVNFLLPLICLMGIPTFFITHALIYKVFLF